MSDMIRWLLRLWWRLWPHRCATEPVVGFRVTGINYRKMTATGTTEGTYTPSANEWSVKYRCERCGRLHG